MALGGFAAIWRTLFSWMNSETLRRDLLSPHQGQPGNAALGFC